MKSFRRSNSCIDRWWLQLNVFNRVRTTIATAKQKKTVDYNYKSGLSPNGWPVTKNA